jgi:hypothetical protein
MEYMGRLDGKTLVHWLVQDGFFAAKNAWFDKLTKIGLTVRSEPVEG